MQYWETKTRYKDVAHNEVICRLAKDMTELEKQFYENMVNEVVFNTPLTLTEHAENQRKHRNLSMGKIRYIYFEGALTEIQFDSSGVKAILSYATKKQEKKKFSSNIVLDLIDGKVISLWNRQFQHDEKKDSNTYRGHKNYIVHKHENTFDLLSRFITLECLKEPVKLVQFLRKYNPTFDKRHEDKLMNYLQGRTLLTQL